MQHVDIYVDILDKTIRKKKRKYGYVLEYKKKNGEIETREGFGEYEGTYNIVTAVAITQALKRMTRKCKVQIHTPNIFLEAQMINLPKQEEKGFKNSKGEDIEEEWKEFWKTCEQQEILVRTGFHEYSDWLKKEMEKC